MFDDNIYHNHVFDIVDDTYYRIVWASAIVSKYEQPLFTYFERQPFLYDDVILAFFVKGDYGAWSEPLHTIESVVQYLHTIYTGKWKIHPEHRTYWNEFLESISHHFQTETDFLNTKEKYNV